MAKEVALKIKVDGSEIKVTEQLLNLLKDSASVSAEEIEQLEMAMKGTNEAIQETTKDLDDLDDALKETTQSTVQNTKAVEDAEEEYTSMGERIGKLEDKLATLRLENKQGTQEYKKTAKEIRRLRDVQEELDISTQRTLTTFSQIPGPIGFIAGGFESLRVAAKSARLGLKNLGFSFKTLDKAIASTGIGALVVLFGLLVAAVIKAFKTFKPLQDAVERFGTLFEVLGDVIQPVIDLIGTALTKALNFLSKAIAFATGRLDEFNQKLADKAAAEAAIAQQERFARVFELTGDQLSETQQKITQARIDAAKKKRQFDEDEELSESEKALFIRLTNERLERDLARIRKEASDKEKADNKRKAEESKRAAQDRNAKRIAAENELQARLDEIRLLQIDDEREREETKLQQDLAREEKAIKDSEKKAVEKEEALKLVREKYRLLFENQREEWDKEDDKYREDKLQEILDAETNTEEEIFQMSLKKTAEKYDKLIDYAKKNNIDTTELEKSKQEELDKLNKSETDKAIQAKRDQLSGELRILELRNNVLQEGTREYFNNLRAIENKAYEQRLLDAGDNAELREAIEKEHQANLKNIKEQEIQAYGEVAAATLNSIVTVGNAIASSYDEEAKTSKKAFEKRKKLQKATAIISAASGIIQILTQPSLLPSPLDWITKGFNAIALGFATAAQIKQINETKFEGDTAGGAGGGITSQRGYAKGGMIGGRRHAQGGTLIEAEQGEAVMTRGAVDRFGPMLSMMNQLGGGVSFNSETSVTSFDNPVVRTPQSEQSPQIIKSYVVEQELTTSQEQAARLKDLSTL